jgi:predicted RNA-binding Zn-ribbon protein involved in translation (DUF1610 family)
MAACTHCGSHVSERFVHVFGDERGRVFACPDCAANVGIAETTKRRAKHVAVSDEASGSPN